MEGITIFEMSNKLGISSNTLKQRITRLGIKPLTKDAIYDKSVLEVLKNTPGKGRPKKPEITSKAAKVTKEKKPKKAKGKK